MKRLIFTAAFVLLYLGVSFGQTLQKGNMVKMTVVHYSLRPGATDAQLMEFIINKYIPESERILKGTEMYLAKGILGEHMNSLAFITIYESEEPHDKIKNDDDSVNEDPIILMNELGPIMIELESIATIFTPTFTTWLVQ